MKGSLWSVSSSSSLKAGTTKAVVEGEESAEARLKDAKEESDFAWAARILMTLYHLGFSWGRLAVKKKASCATGEEEDHW